jgi:glycerate-2-kinase
VSTSASRRPRAQARLAAWFRAGLAAVSPARVLAEAIEGRGDALRIGGERLAPDSRIFALAIGKAACAMARELECRAADRIARGLAITKDGHSLALERFAVRAAGHPVPDARSAEAAREALALAAAARPGDCLVVLLSGGASALTSLPGAGLTLEDLSRTSEWLLASGADIDEMNCVRKHLGAFGGGRLALASPAQRIELLAISDVPGDRLDVIGSGPCTPDPTTWEDALEIARRRGGEEVLPRRVMDQLRRGAGGALPDTPGAGTPALARVRARVVATNADARRAVVDAARADGTSARDAGPCLSGEAREVGVDLVTAFRTARGPAAEGLWVGGGETTVTLHGDGRGGRSQELALAAALAGREQPGWALLAAGTDGGDGPTDAAGAFADGGTVERGRAAGAEAGDALRRNDSHGFFEREGGLLRTGPTHTNVMDLALLALGRTAGEG